MRHFLLFFLLAVTCSHARIRFNGQEAFLDQSTQSLLVVTDSSSLYDYAPTISIADAQTVVHIDGKQVVANQPFRFGDVSKGRRFTLTIADNTGETTYHLQFSSIPVVQIRKADIITNDYSAAVIRIATADATHPEDTLLVEIKRRGGTTNQESRHKRNYRFNVVDAQGESRDVSLFGMREDNGWILDAGQIDLFRLRNNICHGLWLDMSTPPYYASSEPKMTNGCHTQVVEVFLNDEYRGIYSLMEPIDRKQLKLKKFDSKKGVRGCLWKSESYDGTGMWTAPQPYDNTQMTWMGFEAKYPEPGDDADTTDYRLLHEFITFVHGSSDNMFRTHIADYVDLPVYNDYVLFVQMLNGMDNCSKNMYWSVYNQTDPSTSIMVPTVWDMDCTFGQWWINIVDDSSYVRPDNTQADNISNIDYRLSRTYGPKYDSLLSARYSQLRENHFSISSLQARFEKAYQLLSANGADAREEAKWSGDTDINGQPLDFKSQLAYIRQWIIGRVTYMDSKYHYTPTGIRPVVPTPRPVSSVLYNIYGQPVTHPQPGQLIIQNGKKILWR